MAVKRIALLVLLIVLNGLLFGTVVCVGNNNIFNDRNWIDYKANLQLGLQDAQSSLVGRLILSGANMHLGIYHGYQTMISRHTEKIDRMDLKFNFGPNAFLDAVVGGTPPLATGVRFSNTSIRPGQIYKVRSDGKFLIHSKNARLDLTPGWHLGSFRQNGSDIDVWIDSKKILTLPNEALQPQFELRGNEAKILISYVKTYFKNRVVWQDHFFFPTSWRIIFKGCLALAAGFSLALLLIAFVFLRQLPKSTELVSRALGLFLLFQALWFSFDFFYYARIAVVSSDWKIQAYKPTVKYLNFERWRQHYFSSFGEWLGADTAFTIKKSERLGYRHQHSSHYLYTICRDGHCQWIDDLPTVPTKKPKELRILAIGGSEFQGLGALSADSTFFAQLYYKVQSKTSLPVQAFDIALWSDMPRQQVTSAIRLFDVIDPDVVIAGFIKYNYLSLQIRRLLQFLTTKNVEAIFIPGPTDFTRECDSCFDIIKKIYSSFGQEFVPTKKLLFDTDLKQSGFLWMDSYHMTGYANSLLADIVAPIILKKLKARSSGKFHEHAFHRTDDNPSKKTDTLEK